MTRAFRVHFARAEGLRVHAPETVEAPSAVEARALIRRRWPERRIAQVRETLGGRDGAAAPRTPPTPTGDTA